MQQYEYVISAVMPVYNSALYLAEAIESIKAQSIGFDKIQLIIVNDGSTDSSAQIIESYAKKHSNIVFITKKNGGVASARNEGLRHVLGKYVSFPDPDDTISKNTYADAVEFFEKSYERVNVVSFPMYFFGSMSGEHPLNGKFKGGSRIIDLEKEREFQLHITSSIFKSEIARQMSFKSELVASEDAEALLKILIDLPYLGVVPSARYNYRKHDGSLIGTAPEKKGWYFAHLDNYFNSVLDYAERQSMPAPKFVQSALIYDLSWKLSRKNAPSCLDVDELDSFEKAFYKTVARIDDSVILDAKNLPEATRYHLISRKYSSAPQIASDDITLANGKIRLSLCPYQIEFLEWSDGKILISTRIFTPADFPKIESGRLYVNGQTVFSKSVSCEEKTSFVGKCIASSTMLEFELDSNTLSQKSIIYFSVCAGEADVLLDNVLYGKFCPLERKYKHSFAKLGDYAVTYHDNAIVVEKTDKRDVKRRTRALEGEIWKSNGFAERKAVIARALARIYKAFHKKPIWMLSDRLSKAGDNAEALFEHLNETKFKKAQYFFAIRKGEDYRRLKRKGRVVDRASLRYKILFLASDVVVSSHAEDFVINPFDYYWQPYKDLLAKKSFVFLQHGVTKDDLSAWLNRYAKNIKGFVTSSESEHRSIIENEKYHYSENKVWLTGMPRFDRLQSKSTKYVSVMPTWRRYLAQDIDISTGDWKKSERVKNSRYVSFWNGLLNDKRLTEALEGHGYEMLLVPHPNMKEIIDFIDTPAHVCIADKPDYRHIYETSALIITDYSSAVFDFAYLGGGVVYAQFDKDEFFSGAHSYKKGYFDYERDGFGDVTYTLEDTVDTVIRCIENGCQTEQKYKDRADKFFAFRDKDSCMRITEKLMELGKND